MGAFYPMPQFKRLLRLCFMGGEAAFANAEPMESNPWLNLTDEGAAWSAGWIKAHDLANPHPTLH